MKIYILRITSIIKVETDFNTSIAASLIERAVIMYVETSKIDVII